MEYFSTMDLIVFIVYCLIILGIGYFIPQGKKEHDRPLIHYFLTSRTFPWWIAGLSLLAATITAQQLTGFSGLGFTFGLEVSAKELIGALTLIIVIKSLTYIFQVRTKL